MRKTRVVHLKDEIFDVYIGRGSPYGNPFSQDTHSNAKVFVATRTDAVERYRDWVNGKIQVEGVLPPTLEQIEKLKGKVLGCFCAPLECHGDVLAEICDKKTLKKG